MDSKAYKAYSLQEFNRAAEKFDDNNPSVYNMCRKDYPDILEELEKEEFSDVLDAGCGTGAVISLLNEQYPKKRYTGIDLSDKMIEVAKRKALSAGTFVQGDCEELPFSEDSFDAVLCSMSFHHYPNPERFFANVYRVLRPGGRLILRDMTGPAWMIWLVNHIEVPLCNKLLHKGDVRIYHQTDIQDLCKGSGMKLERFEQRKGFRLHCVCRKPKVEG